MQLKNKINEDYMVAFKTKNDTAKSVLSVIKGEIQTQEKKENVQHLSDENVLKILNKMVKSLKETLAAISGDETRGDMVSKTQTEMSIIESYLPKELSISEIEEKLDKIIASGANNIGMIMKEFSSLPVDKKIVSELAKQKLNN